ncbi:MAG: adenylate/guanylate cyclase domain-containing protein [Bacteroidota bacterium]
MPTTRLAAIMFTDIVGYTAMMQRNQAEAMTAVKGYEAVLKARIQVHGGNLLQTYGDGSLSIFDSASAAVLCAKEIQEEIRGKVPLRIGMHLGEITIDGDHTFGDGVNIASRVESMGITGAVLLSSSIRQQIKNRPEFELTSLGKFSFKNVAEPMTVYALANEGFAVPKPGEMKGKGEKVATEKSSPKSWVRMASVGFVAMVVGAMIFWIGGFRGNEEGHLSTKIKEERVAIIPFNNRTPYTNLDVFGGFCSDILTNGLTEAGIKTCSPRTIQQYSHLIGVLPNNPEGKTSFSEVVGARYWVEGYFSQKGDTITVHSYLTDGTNGDIIRNFPEVKGHFENKEGLVGELSKRLMGYWVAKDVIDRGKFRPPKYEAFQEYQKIFTRDEEGWEFALKAYSLDTTFYLAALEEMFWLADRRSPLYDSILALLVPHYDHMTRYEQIRFDANKALYNRDYPNYVKYNEALFKLFPQDLSQTAHYSFHLNHRENMPLKAWEVSNAIDWYNVSDELSNFRKNRIIYISGIGVGAGKYQETIDMLESFLPNEGMQFFIKSVIYTRVNQLDSLYALADILRSSPKLAVPIGFSQEYDLVDFCNDVAEEFLLKGNSKEAQNFLQMAVDWTKEKPERLRTQFDSLDLARTYRLMGEPMQSLSLGEPLVNFYKGNKQKSWEYTSWYYHRYLSGVAIDYVIIGQKEKAKEIINLFSDYGWGPEYFKARVYAVLGEREKAMELLQGWRADWGWSYGSMFLFKHDYFMKNMNGYLPYEEFTQIRD